MRRIRYDRRPTIHTYVVRVHRDGTAIILDNQGATAHARRSGRVVTVTAHSAREAVARARNLA